MTNYDPVFEVTHEAPVRPESDSGCIHFTVVTLPHDRLISREERLLIFADTECLPDQELKKLASAIYFISCRYGCHDADKIRFLLWFADLLCKKAGSAKTSLHCEKTDWYFAPYDARFTCGGYKTRFITMHTYDDSCFCAMEKEALQEVGENFQTWMEIKNRNTGLEGGEREFLTV